MAVASRLGGEALGDGSTVVANGYQEVEVENVLWKWVSGGTRGP